MEALSVTLSAGGRPIVTSRLRTLTVIEGGAGLQPAGLAQGGGRAGPPEQPTRPDTGSGVGPGARAALVRSNAEGETPADRLPARGLPTDRVSASGLTEEEQARVKVLSERDQEVRRHEEAHARVGGQYAGQPSYTYESGPDGRRYAVGGEVPIDVAPIPDDPQATITKMDVVKRAALAPAEPSSADRRIAALADAQRLEAVADLSRKRAEERAGDLEKAAESVLPGTIVDLAKRLERGAETDPGQQFAIAA